MTKRTGLLTLLSLILFVGVSGALDALTHYRHSMLVVLLLCGSVLTTYWSYLRQQQEKRKKM